jgi:hypothetical protein
MTIRDIANQVEAAIKQADDLNKPEAEVHAAVEAIIGDLPVADLKAVYAQVAETTAIITGR